ncbi:DNA-binding transcriptional LysR family regulator [Rhodobium orientis]|nr:LysR family transcriptional regulator [Rhodobium orientis]MBB4301038.1 DNA-binding transcriptional LysR family regulator [Rhodobium orientis]
MQTGLRRLRYFQLLAERLNFHQAARELGVTQPALSRAIAQLETELGVALFERNTRKVALTEAGESFRSGSAEALAMLRSAVLKAQKIAAGDAGDLTIGYTDIAISGRLAELVQSFRANAADVSIQLQEAWTEAQYEMMRAGRLDLGFVTGPVTDPDLGDLLVQADRLVAIVPVGHALAGAEAIRLADLKDADFVLGRDDRWAFFHDILYRVCADAGFSPRVVQRVPNSTAIIGLVACGMGISVQTEHLKSYTDDRVRMIPISDRCGPVGTHLVWRRAGMRPAVQRFVDHVRPLALAVPEGLGRTEPLPH